MSVPPAPPSRSGNAMPMRPCFAIFCAVSNGYLLSCARFSAPGASSSRAKRRTDSANAICSGESWKSIERVQLPQQLQQPARVRGADHGPGELQEFLVDLGVAERRLGIPLSVGREMLDALPVGGGDGDMGGALAGEVRGVRGILAQVHLAHER